MKNVFSLSLLFCLFVGSQTVYAQGKVDINLGIGAFPTFAKDKGKVMLLPLTLNAAYKLTSKFSLGTYVGHSVTKTNREILNDGVLSQWKNHFTTVGIRAAAHTDKLYNWDIYGGMSLSYNYSRIEMVDGSMDKMTKHMGIKPKSGKVAASGFLGTRYAVTENMGLYGELGFGISILTFGFSLRL